MMFPATLQHMHPLHRWWPALMLLSAAALAGSDGTLDLPEFYRTPLPEVIYEQHPTWRATPEEDNGWRRSEDAIIEQGRLRKEILPEFDYEQRSDPTLENRFMNENELARPKTNLFRLKF